MHRRILPALSALLLLIAPALAQDVSSEPVAFNVRDWPMAYRDAQRSNFTPEKVGGYVNYDKWQHQWTYLNDSPIAWRAQPVVAEGIVCFGDFAGKLIAADLVTGETRWTFQTGGAILHSAAIADGRVFCTSDDGCVYGVDAKSGEQLWKVQTGEGLSVAPLVVDGVVYAGSKDGKFYAVDAESGEVRWTCDVGEPIIMSAAYSKATNLIYTGTSHVKAVAITPDGEVAWTRQLTGQGLQEACPMVSEKDNVVVYRPHSIYSMWDQISWAGNGHPEEGEARLQGIFPEKAPKDIHEEQDGISKKLATDEHRITFWALDAKTGKDRYEQPVPVLWDWGISATMNAQSVDNETGTAWAMWRTLATPGSFCEMPQPGLLDLSTGRFKEQPAFNTVAGHGQNGLWGGDEPWPMMVAGDTIFMNQNHGPWGWSLVNRKTFIMMAQNIWRAWDGGRAQLDPTPRGLFNYNPRWKRNVVSPIFTNRRVLWAAGSGVYCWGTPDLQADVPAPATGPDKDDLPRWAKTAPAMIDWPLAEGQLDAETYVNETVTYTDIDAEATADLRAKLATEVEALLAVGELPSPMRFLRGYVGYCTYWGNPAETVQTLCDVAPLLEEDLRTRALDFAKQLVQKYPPWKTGFVAEGPRRELYPLPDDVRPGAGKDTPPNAPPVSNLYALWTYANATGDWDTVRENWAAITDLYQRATRVKPTQEVKAGRMKAGIHGRAFSNNLPGAWEIKPGSLQVTLTAAEDVTETFKDDGEGRLVGDAGGWADIDYRTGQIKGELGAHETLRGTGIRLSFQADAVGDRTYAWGAGLLAYARMAEAIDDPKAAQARAAAVFAIKEVDRLGYPGMYKLATRQLIYAPHDWAYPPLHSVLEGKHRWTSTLAAPEILRLLADRQGQAVAQHLDSYIDGMNFRAWHLYYGSLPPDGVNTGTGNTGGGGEALGGENAVLGPDLPWVFYMLKAYVLDASPQQLRAWLDIPYANVGDLYYMQKLAAAIRATGQAQWTTID